MARIKAVVFLFFGVMQNKYNTFRTAKSKDIESLLFDFAIDGSELYRTYVRLRFAPVNSNSVFANFTCCNFSADKICRTAKIKVNVL